MKFIQKYHSLFIPLLFLLGFIIPFNGYWLSGLFYFFLSWLGLIGFFSDFQWEYLKSIHLLLGHAVPIFSTITVYFYLVYSLVSYKFFAYVSKITGTITILSYLSFIYLSIQDMIIHDFSFSFFNQTLWFISSLLCVFSLFKWTKDDTIEKGDIQNAIY